VEQEVAYEKIFDRVGSNLSKERNSQSRYEPKQYSRD